MLCVVWNVHFYSKLAATALELFAHEGSFDLQLDDREECDAVATALEARGCSVERSYPSPRLSVIVPASLGQAQPA